MWKPVFGFEDIYEVSDCGEVRRLEGFGSSTTHTIKSAIDKKGYARVKLSKHGAVTTISVHKLVAEAFIRPMSAKDTINHKNCEKTDNRPSNLEYCSRQENTRHAVKNGRISLSNAKLTEEDVRAIRCRYTPNSGSSRVLAAEYGVSQRTICRLIDGTNWKHVT